MVHKDFQSNNGNNDVTFQMCLIISLHLGCISMVDLAVGFCAYSFAFMPYLVSASSLVRAVLPVRGFLKKVLKYLLSFSFWFC